MDNDVGTLTSFLLEEAQDPQTPLIDVGVIVGNWVVKAFLGGGGFGEVYRVEHKRLPIECAMKILKKSHLSERSRFLREVEILARQMHLGMPRFYELGEFAEHPYVIMELLQPKDLPKKEKDVAEYLHKLCRVVATMHKNGFVHRDIKPSNVLYRADGELVLIDFGLTKAVSRRESYDRFSCDITKPHEVVGTIRYAAPEQLAGGPVDVSADIHSIGVLADTCYDGTPPRWWRRIIQKATSSIPEQRFDSVIKLDRAIKFRFLNELMLAVAIIFFATVLFFAFTMRLDSNTDAKDVAQESFMTITNRTRSLLSESKEVGDSAAEWF